MNKTRKLTRNENRNIIYILHFMKVINMLMHCNFIVPQFRY